MTVKQFFKSNAFRSLAVLIAIVLVAGALLAIFNDILYISDEERLNRTLSKIYGENVTAEEVTLDEDAKTTPYGTVNFVYHIQEDGNYLFQTTGTGGYQGGTVTVWTVVAVTGTREAGDLAITGIDKVVYESNTSQTLMANLTDSFYAFYTEHDDLVADGEYFTSVKGGTDDLNNVVANATMSSGAVTNAVNAALYCCRTQFVSQSGQPEPPSDEVLEEIFGERVALTSVAVTDAQTPYGTVDEVWLTSGKSAYLFKTTGTGGFQGGSVTLWTAVTFEGTGSEMKLTGIEKVVYLSNISQSWMNKIPDSYYDNFADKDDLVAAGGYFTANPDGSGDLNNVQTGVSLASNASCNAVNAALCYFRTVLLGEESGEEPAPLDPVEEFYGERVNYTQLTIDELYTSNEYGAVDAVYYVAEKNEVLILSTGTGGFQGGTVTLWTSLTVTGSLEDGLTLTGIGKVVYDSDVDQSWMNKIPDSFFANFADKDDLVAAGGYFTANPDGSGDLNNVETGVSKASNAACNAVNAALCYFRLRLTDPVERFYGEEVDYTQLTLGASCTTNEYGTVDAIYYVAEKNEVLILATGTGGFRNGTVTLWTSLTATGSLEGGLTLTGIGKVVYDSNIDQSWMNKIPDSFYDNFADKDDLVAAGEYFTANPDTGNLNNLETGVSLASNAACNAVNAALCCFRMWLTDPVDRFYGEQVDSTQLTLDAAALGNEYGTVEAVYYIAEKNELLVLSTGTGGFRNGTVTLWTSLTVTGSLEDGLTLTGIGKVVFASETSQSWMDKIPDSYYDNFADKDDLVAAGGYFTANPDGTGDLNNVQTGVSKASNAACNAVNAALCYFREVLTGGNA